MAVEIKPKDVLQTKNVNDYSHTFELNSPFDAPEIDRCPRCGAIGKDIKTNRLPMIIVNCKLDFPKYTCIKCGYNWGSLL